MTQRLISGKTIRIEADTLSIEGLTEMDRYSDQYPPFNFKNTILYPASIRASGISNIASQVFLFTKNDRRCRIEIQPNANTVFAMLSTELRFPIPDSIFHPDASTYFICTLAESNSTPVQVKLVLDTDGVLTFTGLTVATAYTFRYGCVFPYYFVNV